MDTITGSLPATGDEPSGNGKITIPKCSQVRFVRKRNPIPEIQYFAITGQDPQSIAWVSHLLNYRRASRCIYAPWARRIDPGLYPDEFHYLGVAETDLHELDVNFLGRARAVFLLDSFEDAPVKLQKAIVSHPQKIAVHIESLKVRAVVEDIWDFCLPGIPFCEERYMQMRYKRIDLDQKEDYTEDYTEKLKATVARLAN